MAKGKSNKLGGNTAPSPVTFGAASTLLFWMQEARSNRYSRLITHGTDTVRRLDGDGWWRRGPGSIPRPLVEECYLSALSASQRGLFPPSTSLIYLDLVLTTTVQEAR